MTMPWKLLTGVLAEKMYEHLEGKHFIGTGRVSKKVQVDKRSTSN